MFIIGWTLAGVLLQDELHVYLFTMRVLTILLYILPFTHQLGRFTICTLFIVKKQYKYLEQDFSIWKCGNQNMLIFIVFLQNHSTNTHASHWRERKNCKEAAQIKDFCSMWKRENWATWKTRQQDDKIVLEKKHTRSFPHTTLYYFAYLVVLFFSKLTKIEVWWSSL